MWKNVKFHPGAQWYRAYLDGQFLEHCFAANEEECWADVYILGLNNHPFPQPLSDSGIAEIRLFGYVELKETKRET